MSQEEEKDVEELPDPRSLHYLCDPYVYANDDGSLPPLGHQV